jgi:FlaG/FlaF family flagellin (archaellin)
MARNRFEQVSEIQPDAITLVLKRDNDGTSGSIVFPATVSGGRLSTDQVSGQLPAQDAYRGAIRLANDMKVAIVVCDPDGVWKSEWGDLYQAID